MPESKDLKDGYWRVEDHESWLVCPHCGSEDVDLQNINQFSDIRQTVKCSDCGAGGYYD